MKRKITLVVLSVLLLASAVGVIGCQTEAPTPAPTPAPTSAPTPTSAPAPTSAPTPTATPAPTPAPTPEPEPWEWPETLVTLAQSNTSLDGVIQTGWTTPLAEDTGMKVRIVAEETDMIRWQWLKTGRFFNMGLATEPAEYFEAKGDRATRDGGPFQLRTWWPVGVGGYGYAVRGDSDITVPGDIKPGTKVLYLSFIPSGKAMVSPILAWAGLSEDDIEWVPAGSIAAHTRALMDGKGDIGVGFPSSPTWLEAEAGPHGLKWVDMNAKEDPEGAARFMEVNPSVRFGIMDIGAESAQGIWMTRTIPRYATTVDTDTELIYNLVKWLDENHEAYKAAHPYCAYMTLDTLMKLAETDYLPLHDGAVKYLEEKGLWTAAHELRRQQNIDLITKWIEAYETAIDQADQQRISVNPQNEEWTKFWEDYKKAQNLPHFKFFTDLSG